MKRLLVGGQSDPFEVGYGVAFRSHVLLGLSREWGSDPYKPSLVVSFTGTPG